MTLFDTTLHIWLHSITSIFTNHYMCLHVIVLASVSYSVLQKIRLVIVVVIFFD